MHKIVTFFAFGLVLTALFVPGKSVFAQNGWPFTENSCYCTGTFRECDSTGKNCRPVSPNLPNTITQCIEPTTPFAKPANISEQNYPMKKSPNPNAPDAWYSTTQSISDCNKLTDVWNENYKNSPSSVLGTYRFTQFQKCEFSPDTDCATAKGASPTTSLTPVDFKIQKPLLNILIPDLTFSDINTTTDENGNIQIPWIGEYIVAVYRLLVSVASILGVILIIREGVIIIITVGEEKADAYHHIFRILIGLVLAWFSYVILYNLNSSLVAIRPISVKAVINNISDEKEEEETSVEEQEGQAVVEDAKKNNDKAAHVTYSKCAWANHSMFDCDAWKNKTIKPCGGVPDDPAIIDTFDKCGDIQILDMAGRRKTVKVLKEVSGPLCNAIKIAKGLGYEIRINSSLRDFNNQAKLWCDEYEGQKDKSKPPGGVGTPGYSNHMYGRAVDAYLFKDGKALMLYGYSDRGQCKGDADAVKKIAEIFYSTDPKNSNLKWYRLDIETWHFELKSSPGSTRYDRFYGFPASCSNQPQNKKST